MIFLKVLIVAAGLLVFSDPFQALMIEEQGPDGTWQVMPAHPSKKNSLLSSREDTKPKSAVKRSANTKATLATVKAVAEEFGIKDIVEAVKQTHTARLEETKERQEARKSVGSQATNLDQFLDVIIPSVKKGTWFVVSEVLPRAVNVAIKTAPYWLPYVIALL